MPAYSYTIATPDGTVRGEIRAASPAAAKRAAAAKHD